MIAEKDIYKIGQLGKPHGVRGEITFSFTTDVWDRVEADYLILMVDGIPVPFFLEEYRFRGEYSALLKFTELDSIDAIQDIVGVEVYFPYSLTPDNDDADYTWNYFEGFRVIDAEAGDLGCIVRVDDSTQNVLFELENGLLLPAVEAFISSIDHDNRAIRMQLPDGLLDMN
ncbi:MAG: ribosome maturation factor RimM [Bacteroidaceae bacterium]|nr:ribosome maturation factor RimM [Bacteroidaceae bacterium]